jgi:hypothetical protein
MTNGTTQWGALQRSLRAVSKLLRYNDRRLGKTHKNLEALEQLQAGDVLPVARKPELQLPHTPPQLTLVPEPITPDVEEVVELQRRGDEDARDRLSKIAAEEAALEKEEADFKDEEEDDGSSKLEEGEDDEHRVILLVRPIETAQFGWWPRTSKGDYKWSTIEANEGCYVGYHTGQEAKYAMTVEEAETAVDGFMDARVDPKATDRAAAKDEAESMWELSMIWLLIHDGKVEIDTKAWVQNGGQLR